MSAHKCHVRSCKAPCPPRWLTCRRCWQDVPKDLADEVYRTVKLRNMRDGPDATWAPWWRAQARAIDAVYRAGVQGGRWSEAGPGTFDRELIHDLRFADRLDGTITHEEYDRLEAAEFST